MGKKHFDKLTSEISSCCCIVDNINNVASKTLFNAVFIRPEQVVRRKQVNNIVHHYYTCLRADSGSTILFKPGTTLPQQHCCILFLTTCYNGIISCEEVRHVNFLYTASFYRESARDEADTQDVSKTHVKPTFSVNRKTSCRVCNFSIDAIQDLRHNGKLYRISGITFLHMNRTKS